MLITGIDSTSANLQHCKNKTNWKKITQHKNKHGTFSSFVAQPKNVNKTRKIMSIKTMLKKLDEQVNI